MGEIPRSEYRTLGKHALRRQEGRIAAYLKYLKVNASGGPAVLQPRIYFGEGSLPYVIVKTAMPEFDYPKGSNNAYTTYDGSAGVVVGSLARRSLFAWHFGDPNILISSYLTPESRILFHRDVQDRISSIAPFLSLDHNPYVVVSDGRLYWIQDAYTTSSWFPYSPPAPGTEINYIRNSVKIVVDAYNGSVDFYEIDPNDYKLRSWGPGGMAGPVAFATGGSGLEFVVKKPGTEWVLAVATAKGRTLP